MQITTDTSGYVTAYATVGDIIDSVTVDAPADMSDFEAHYTAYRLTDGALVLDADKLAADAEASELAALRSRRQAECFGIVNRGFAWYDRLTDAQHAELDTWYQAWLDVTETREPPPLPTWLKL